MTYFTSLGADKRPHQSGAWGSAKLTDLCFGSSFVPVHNAFPTVPHHAPYLSLPMSTKQPLTHRELHRLVLIPTNPGHSAGVRPPFFSVPIPFLCLSFSSDTLSVEENTTQPLLIWPADLFV